MKNKISPSSLSQNMIREIDRSDNQIILSYCFQFVFLFGNNRTIFSLTQQELLYHFYLHIGLYIGDTGLSFRKVTDTLGAVLANIPWDFVASELWYLCL